MYKQTYLYLNQSQLDSKTEGVEAKLLRYNSTPYSRRRPTSTHSDVTSTSLRIHFEFTWNPLQLRYDVFEPTSASLLYRSGPASDYHSTQALLRRQLNLTSASVPPHLHLTSASLRHPFEITTIRRRLRF